MGSGSATRLPPHVAILVPPGMGHLIPLAELAKLLASRHGVTTTLLTFASTASATQRAFLASLPPAVASHSLPPVDLSDLQSRGAAAVETLITEECTRSAPALAAILSDLRDTTRLVAFVTDFFGVAALDAARAAGLERRYLFCPVNLHALSLVLHLPELAASVAGEFRDLAEPVRLPGCVPVPGPDIISPLQNRSDPSYEAIVRLAERCRRDAHAILVNSFDAVEPEVARLLREPEPGRPPVYAIGPLVRTDDAEKAASPSNQRAACLEWLDRQPARSVIFVSFGSGGALPKDQMRELALGLELSGQRFLWVVRSPSGDDEGGPLNGNYYDAESKKDPFAYLPEGFVDRTRDVGLVVPSWAPQVEVLAHGATGGFLTHCGWNSTLESLVHGVPMVAWPLFAEQRMNAVMLSEGAGAAIRLPEKKDKETIAATVMELMVGAGKGAMVRANVAELQMVAKDSFSEGGAATSALDELVNTWAIGN